MVAITVMSYSSSTFTSIKIKNDCVKFNSINSPGVVHLSMTCPSVVIYCVLISSATAVFNNDLLLSVMILVEPLKSFYVYFCFLYAIHKLYSVINVI